MPPETNGHGAAAATAWTVRDVEDFERLLGIDFAALRDALNAEGTTMGGRLRVMAALVYITRRRTDPTFTFDAALDLPLPELTDTASGITDELAADPTTAPVTPPLPAPATRG